jgi:hypothetical protein
MFGTFCSRLRLGRITLFGPGTISPAICLTATLLVPRRVEAGSFSGFLAATVCRSAG